MPAFSVASAAKLATCDQRLQDICNEVIKWIDFTVITGHRNEVDQEKAFSEGKSQKHWPQGNHNSLPSRAVDVWPWTPEGKIDWKDAMAAARLMGYVQRVAQEKGIKLRFGLDWDQDWRTSGVADPDEHFLDAPHMELVDP
jgi:peptidoglycan L-alanyl-D-glutamate endopeptidase CwlK